MALDHHALLYAALFVGVLLAFEGLLQLITDLRSGPRAQVNRRIQMLADGRSPHDVLASLRRSSRTQGIVGAVPMLGSLDRLLTQAGSSASIGRALLWMAMCGALAFALLRLVMALPPPLALLLAAVLGIGLPVLHLMRRKARRLRRFEEQLPGALDLLVRSLR
ncbi:MAG: hypothetical protein ACREH3_04175, partial [Geminicoccales bacterium]